MLLWMPLSVLPAMLLSACRAPAPGGQDCVGASLVGSVPADGDTWVRPDAALRLTLDGPADAVALWIDGGVTDGWVELGAAGPDLEFVPDASLPRDADLTVRLETCGAPAGELTFSTLPPPVEDQVTGRTFVFDLLDPALVWREPASPPPTALLSEALADTTSVLLMPTAVDGDRLTLAVSLGEGPAGARRQHSCVQTVVLEELDFSEDPYLALGPLDLEVMDRGVPFSIDAIELEGAFVDQGESVEELRLSGRVDIRQLDAADDYDLCGVFADLYDATCVACADQSEADPPACLLLEAVAPLAVYEEDLVVDPDLAPGEGC